MVSIQLDFTSMAANAKQNKLNSPMKYVMTEWFYCMKTLNAHIPVAQ